MPQKFVCFTISLMLGIQLCAQPKFSFSTDKKEAKIQFDLKSNLIIVPVLINGVELNFLVDTGVALP